MAIGPYVFASGTGDVDGDTVGIAACYNLRLCGFSIGESATPAATAEVKIHHGTADSDPLIVAPINLAADGFGTFWYPDGGIPCPNGVFIERVSGTSTIVLYVDRV